MSRKYPHQVRKHYEHPGQPTKFDDLARQRIRDAAAVGANITQTCFLLGITTMTYRNWRDLYPEFFAEIELLQERMPLKAKQNIAKAIDEGSIELSKWLLEKKDPDFIPKSKLEHGGEIATYRVIDRTPEELAALQALRIARRKRIEINARKTQ